MAYQTTYGVTRGVAQEYHFSVGCHLPPPSSFVRAFVDADSRTGLVPLSILVAIGQITRAIVHIADFNGEILEILKTGIGKLRSLI